MREREVLRDGAPCRALHGSIPVDHICAKVSERRRPAATAAQRRVDIRSSNVHLRPAVLDAAIRLLDFWLGSRVLRNAERELSTWR